MDAPQFHNFSSKEFGSRIESSLRRLQKEKFFCDVTITCEGQKIDAHKVVLARGSRIFNNILKLNTQSHPLIFLSDVKFSYLLNILDFMYQGEVSVDKRELNNFLAVARNLQVNDLTEEALKDSEEFIEGKSKKQRVGSSSEQQFNLDYKIKTDNKLDDCRTVVNNLKIDELEDFERFTDEDFADFDDEKEGIAIKNNRIDSSPRQDLNVEYKIKIEIENENENSEKNDGIISTKGQGKEESNSRVQGLLIRDIAKLSGNEKKDQPTSFESHVSKTRFECDHCSKTYSTKYLLKTHVLSIHEGMRYPCSQCDYKSTTNELLRRHILIIHVGIRHTCSQCDYQATTVSNLKTHVLAIHKGRRFPCSHCDYKSTTKDDLKIHTLSIHEGMRYPCPHCDIKATTKLSLKKHVLSIHEGQMRYPCSYCDCEANQKSNLKTHINKRHL